MTIETNSNLGSERILRLPEVIKRTGLSRSTIYMKIQEKTFPKQINLSVRSTGWLESEITEWISKRIASSRLHIPKPT